MRVYTQYPIEYNYYCNDPVNIGDVLFVSSNDDKLVVPINGNHEGILAGISLNNVIQIDFTKNIPNYTDVNIGSKIILATSGTIIVLMLEYDRIGIGQNIYIDNNGKPTWRRGRYYLGETCSSQDQNGYIKIKLKF